MKRITLIVDDKLATEIVNMAMTKGTYEIIVSNHEEGGGLDLGPAPKKRKPTGAGNGPAVYRLLKYIGEHPGVTITELKAAAVEIGTTTNTIQTSIYKLALENRIRSTTDMPRRYYLP